MVRTKPSARRPRGRTWDQRYDLNAIWHQTPSRAEHYIADKNA